MNNVDRNTSIECDLQTLLNKFPNIKSRINFIQNLFSDTLLTPQQTQFRYKEMKEWRMIYLEIIIKNVRMPIGPVRRMAESNIDGISFSEITFPNEYQSDPILISKYREQEEFLLMDDDVEKDDVIHGVCISVALYDEDDSMSVKDFESAYGGKITNSKSEIEYDGKKRGITNGTST